MSLVSHLLAVVAVLAAGIIYGTDVLGALVMRPTWEKVDDRALVMVNGHMHYFGDRRFPVPGILSVVTTILAGGASALSGRWPAAAAALVATAALVAWLAIYQRVNAPVNRVLTAAAQEGRVPQDARALQTRWDSVITWRAVLQGIAVAALCAVLALP
jgi:hypothetical protein